MPVRHSGVTMGQLRGRLKALARGPHLPLGLYQNLAQEAKKQLADEFNEARDPYGHSWQQTYRGGRILQETARLKNSLRPVATPMGFTITTAVIYAAVHQYGARISARAAKYLRFQVRGRWAQKKSVDIPRRQYLPEKATGGLGPIWTPAFKRVINAYVRAFMKVR